jgi:hypothetical protein
MKCDKNPSHLPTLNICTSIATWLFPPAHATASHPQILVPARPLIVVPGEMRLLLCKRVFNMDWW